MVRNIMLPQVLNCLHRILRNTNVMLRLIERMIMKIRSDECGFPHSIDHTLFDVRLQRHQATNCFEGQGYPADMRRTISIEKNKLQAETATIANQAKAPTWMRALVLRSPLAVS